MKFTYLEYERLIYFLLDNGYTVTGYDNYRHVEYPVILRHDIDTSLDKAVKMAELENSIGGGKLDLHISYSIMYFLSILLNVSIE